MVPCLATFPFPVGGGPCPTAEASGPHADHPDLMATRLALRSPNRLHTLHHLGPQHEPADVPGPLSRWDRSNH